MDQLELNAELDRIRERARQRFWRRWALTFVPGYVAISTIANIDSSDNVGRIVLRSALVLAVLAVFAALLVRGANRGWRWLPDPPITAGLPRGQSRIVSRDLRRGTPNNDPLFREIENGYVARYQRSGQVTAWLTPALGAAFIVFAVLADSAIYRVLAVIAAAFCVIGTLYQVQLNRGMRAFV